MRTIVIGAGAAGSALAARLSTDPRRRVTLVESGSDTAPTFDLLDGTTLLAAVPGHASAWGYRAELSTGVRREFARGRALGGSSAVNGGYQVRATAEDFNDWARTGGPAWSFEQVLPLMESLEHDEDYGVFDGHGSEGPIRLRRSRLTDPMSRAFCTAAEELGFAWEADKNAPRSAPGVGPVPSNMLNGFRVSTAISLLEPVRHRPNLEVIGATRCLRVVLDEHSRPVRALGVEVCPESAIAGGQIPPAARIFLPADEVILCAGAIESPHLLMLSGVGPRKMLERSGIPVQIDLPVGDGFSDHPNLALGWIPRAGSVATATYDFPFPAALNFASDEPGGLTSSATADLEILLVARPLGRMLGSDPSAAEQQLLVTLQSPQSRGCLTLDPEDALGPPTMEYRYLTLETDRRRMRRGVRTAAELLSSPAFSNLFGGFATLTSETLADDARLDAWILAHLGTAMHTCGTAAMGRVVDGGGLVTGTENLRVADTSILPSVPSRGPFNTAILIGALVAEHMLGALHSSAA